MTDQVRFRDIFRGPFPPEKDDPLHDAKLMLLLGGVACSLALAMMVGLLLMAVNWLPVRIVGVVIFLVFLALFLWFWAARTWVDIIRPIVRWVRRRRGLS